MKTFLSLVVTVLAGSLLPACVASGDDAQDNGAESTVDTTGDAVVTTGVTSYMNDNGMLIDVDHASKSNDARIVEYHLTGSLQQQWHWVALGDGTAMLWNSNSGKCMDTDHGGTGNGTAVVQYDCHPVSAGPLDSQRWRRTSNYEWVHANGGRCLDEPGGRAQDSLGLQLWDCNGTPGQRWRPRY